MTKNQGGFTFHQLEALFKWGFHISSISTKESIVAFMEVGELVESLHDPAALLLHIEGLVIPSLLRAFKGASITLDNISSDALWDKYTVLDIEETEIVLRIQHPSCGFHAGYQGRR